MSSYVIGQSAATLSRLLVDIHSHFQTLQSGVSIDSYDATTTFLGGIFSLDSLHPTNIGCALIANQYIAAVNSNAKPNITPVNVSAVAAVDPNIKPAGESVPIPLNAARRID
jgi:hypothetical protein